MKDAEGKATLWGKMQGSLLGKVTRSLQEATAVYSAATLPLKAISRDHSFENERGLKVASTGVRIIAVWAHLLLSIIIYFVMIFLVGFVYGLLLASDGNISYSDMKNLTALSALLTIVYSLVLVIFTIIAMCNGQTLDQQLFGLQTVDKKSGAPFGFIKMFGYTLIFYGVGIEWLILPFTGKTLAQRIMDAEIVVIDKKSK